MPTRHYVSKAVQSVALLAIIVAISGATMRLHRLSAEQLGPNLFLSDAPSIYDNDTCAWDIMERFNCSEVACEDQAGMFNYLYLQECVAHGWQRPTFIVCWFVLLAFIIYILATTADRYFCVTLTDMVEKMGIPPSIAGVTFLSFGNGGPDVFALMTAVIGGHSHIGMGSNLGAGLFITTVITGVVAFMSDCKVNPLSFYRDIVTYIVSTVYTAIVFFDKKIHLWEIIGFIIIYLIYVAIVIIFRKQSSDVYEDIETLSRNGSAEVLITQNEVDEIVGTTGLSVTAKVKIMSEPMYSVRHMVKEMVMDELDDDDDESHPILPERYKSIDKINPSLNQTNPQSLSEMTNLLTVAEEEPNVAQENAKWTLFKSYVTKEVEYYKKLPWYWKIVYWLEAPLTILRNVTIPVVMEERYNKFHLLLTSFGIPLFLFYKSEKAWTDTMIGVPYWVVLLIAIPLLFIFFECLTPWEQPPSGWMFFVVLFIAFFMSIMWVEEIADELVSLMNALGCIAGIQPFVMGLTILAVGNSISDLVGDVTITKQGYPQMAIGGIYASPMFSLLVGLGIALSIRYAEDPNATSLGEDTEVINLTFIFLLVTLFSTLIVVPLQKYTYTKKFGIYLISLYLVSMLLNVLAAGGILNIPFLMPKALCVCSIIRYETVLFSIDDCLREFKSIEPYLSHMRRDLLHFCSASFLFYPSQHG